MIDIIPNWHPAIVHFPVALLISAAALFVAARLPVRKAIGQYFYYAAFCNLWLGTAAALVAVATGWQAFQTVAHDEAGHMAIHMRWAFATAGISALAAVAAARSNRDRGTRAPLLVLLLAVLAAASVAVTGYLGGENVYRHGIGVLRLPEQDEHEHSHMDDDHD